MGKNREADDHGEARRHEAGGGPGGPGREGDDLSIEVSEQEMIDALQGELNALQERLNEAQDRWKRAAADLENFRRRALQGEQEARRQGATSVLASIVPVLDNFDIALSVNAPDEASRQVLEGVKVIQSSLLRALEGQGVGVIAPQPGDEFDPNRHEAMMKHPAEGVAPGHISMVMQSGYTLDSRVIRPAKVAVAPGKED
jgi:molecular chaperone GrpE